MKNVSSLTRAGLAVTALLLSVAGGPGAAAQQPEAVAAAAEGRRAPAGEDIVDPVKLNALEVIRGEVERSKKYSSAADRVVVLTAAADALWESDPGGAKSILREAFGEVKQATPRGRAGESDYGLALRRVGLRERLRLEILRVLQRHDPESLAEFVRVPEERRAQLTSTRTQPQFFGSSSSEKKSLARLAASVARSDPDLAVRLSVESLGFGVPEEIQEVFQALLAVAPDRAHTLFARLTDAYVADDSQNLFDAVIISYYLRQLPRPSPDLALARRFLGASYERVRHVRERAQAEGDKSLNPTLLMVLTLHLPVARQYWPELSDRMWTLSRQLAPDAPAGADEAFQNTFSGAESADDFIARADAEKSDENRDSLYFRAALLLAGKGEFGRALEVASRAKPSPKREKVTAYLLREQAEALIGAGELNDARKILEKLADPEERAGVAIKFVSAARKKKDPYLAKVVLGETRKSMEANLGQPEYARAFLWLASSYAGLDAADGFELMEAAVKFANQAGGLEDLSAEPRLLDLGGVVRQAIPVGESRADFLPGFRALARYDFTRTLRVAEGFENELFRGVSLIAASGARLKEGARPSKPGGVSMK